MATASPPRRILVIQTAFLGDIVLTTPFLANLRHLAPTAEIRFLTTPAGAKMLSPNTAGVHMIPYDKRGRDRGFRGFLRVARGLREFRPDLTFCLHPSMRSALLARVAGGEIFGFRDNPGSRLFGHRVPRPQNVFEAEKHQALLAAWAGGRAEGGSLYPSLAATPAEEGEAAALLQGVERFVAIAPSSVWATKRWPAERFARLAVLFAEKGWRTVLVGGNDPADLAAAQGVVEGFRALGATGPEPLNLAGKTSLGNLKSVLCRASLVVANDSAPLHVAIAVGAPVVGIFGPTTRELGFFPLAPAGKAAVVERAGLTCRPCGRHGHDACPEGHFRCMLEIEAETVFREAEKILCP